MTNEGKIIVTGMHRSGTSMVMSFLADYGVYMGSPEDLLPPSMENPKGYFENRAILDYNDALLSKLGGSWRSLDHLAAIDDLETTIKRQLFQIANETLYPLFEGYPLWALKDPRFMLLLRFWHEIIPDMKVVLCVRNPIEVALSLSNRIGEYHVGFHDALVLWQQYYELFLEQSKDIPVIFTHIESFFYDAKSEVNRILNFLEIDKRGNPSGNKNFSREFRHFHFDDSLIKTMMPGGELLHVYTDLCERCGDVFKEQKGSTKNYVSNDIQNIKTLIGIQELSFSLSEKLKLTAQESQQFLESHMKMEGDLVFLQNKQNMLETSLDEQRICLSQKDDEIINLLDKVNRKTSETFELQNSLSEAKNLSMQLNSQLQGILGSRTWRFIEASRHYFGIIFPFLLKSPYRRGTLKSNVSNIVNPMTELPIYPDIQPNDGRKKALYIYPDDKSLRASCIYRVFNMVEYLKTSNLYFAEAKSYLTVEKNPAYCLDFDILVFFRLPINSVLENLVNRAKKRKIICCYDIDDYVFDLGIFQYVDPLRNFQHEELISYFDGVMRYRALLEMCDFFIGSTEHLANLAENLKIESVVIRNGLNHIQENKAEVIVMNSDLKSDNSIKIAYLSGTNTHNKDFLVVESALIRILSEFKNVQLSIRGQLSLSKQFDPYLSQIEFLPFIPFEDLVPAMDLIDIFIAPLELNPYTQAKSELKYFEPALIKKPVIASPSEAFKYAIQDGFNGFLADTEEEWYQKIKSLVTQPKLRENIGKNARIHAVANYGVTAQQQNVEKTLQKIEEKYFGHALPLDLSSLDIQWIIPVPKSGSGGHRVIFEICNSLSMSGHTVSLHFLPDPDFQNPEQLKEFIADKFFKVKGKIFLGLNDIGSCDALIATSWNTAASVYNNQKLARKTFYFVQDFEPYFFPMSSDYIAAYSTYSLRLNHITIGEWLVKKLKDEFDASAKSIPFPIDHQIYRPDNQSNNHGARIRVAFFARNNMARRCYPLGIEALKLLKKQRPDIDVILFGSNDISESDFPYEYINMGVLSPPDLADLYRSCCVGISFSTTNPSIVPFEMMACGLPVVDLDFNENHIHYGSFSNVTLAKPNPKAITNAILVLINDQKEWQRKRENGIAFSKKLPSRLEAAKLFEELLLESFQE